MSAAELLAPYAPEAVPFSVRLAARRLASRAEERAAAAARDRRTHERRNAADLEWLRSVRLTGGTGYDVRLVDLSAGGALLEIDEPLRPGLVLTLEMSGPGLETAVPLEVLRCYIANLRGQTATYRGAVAFAHLIDLPGRSAPTSTAVADFSGTETALTNLVERCMSARRAAADGPLERKELLRGLDALRRRTSTPGSDMLSRHASDLLSAILPALHSEEPREIALAALDAGLRGLAPRWRTLLGPTSGRLAALVDHCLTTNDSDARRIVLPPSFSARPIAAAPAAVAEVTAAGAESAFQKIVVRQADGQIVKGYAQDFHPSRPQFSIWPSINAAPRERIVVAVSQLKAVFFVRDFQGNATQRDRQAFGSRSQGRRVEVTFTDGEVVLGTTLNYRPDGQGFFVSPADPDSNNTRIYVVGNAVRRVRFL